MNAPAEIAIGLIYGFVSVALFCQLVPALPAGSGLAKGLALGLGTWFFLVVMAVASTWMSQKVGLVRLACPVATGLADMPVLGAFVGLLLSLPR